MYVISSLLLSVVLWRFIVLCMSVFMYVCCVSFVCIYGMSLFMYWLFYTFLYNRLARSLFGYLLISVFLSVCLPLFPCLPLSVSCFCLCVFLSVCLCVVFSVMLWWFLSLPFLDWVMYVVFWFISFCLYLSICVFMCFVRYVLSFFVYLLMSVIVSVCLHWCRYSFVYLLVLCIDTYCFSC